MIPEEIPISDEEAAQSPQNTTKSRIVEKGSDSLLSLRFWMSGQILNLKC
tara:strand:+ start:7325 stop:7474 length:150 start_codon:yes stop_codon:yes gene_type:complete